MTDRLDEGLPGIDGPRPLDPGFRARLEQTIIDAGAILAAREPDEDPGRWLIDGPRAVPPGLRSRLEATLTRRRASRGSLRRGIAAATALIMVTSSMLVASRSGDRDAPSPIVAAPGAQGPEAPPRRKPAEPEKRPPGSLQAFGSSSEFLAYVRAEGLKRVGPYGFGYDGMYLHGDVTVAPRSAAATVGGSSGAGSGAPAASVPQPRSAFTSAEGQAFSTTNIQEAGVDEPDLVKTDGRVLATLAHSRLWLLDVADGTPSLRGSLRIDGATGMFLVGERVVVLTQLWSDETRSKLVDSAPGREWTKLLVVDIADPRHPRIASSLDLEGSTVGARLAGGVVRLILRSGSLGPAPVLYQGDGSAPAVKKLEEANKDLIRRSEVGDWMPHFLLKEPGRVAEAGHVHTWDAVSRPAERTGLGMTTVLTIDPADPRPDEALSVIGAGEMLYASPTGLYVTSSLDEQIVTRTRPGRLVAPQNPITRIHKFDISDPARARYIGSGSVPGYLLNQFSMSEHEGYLRVASTLQPEWAVTRKTSSLVTILREDGLKLARVGKVGNLGKGERIYAVRFMGDKGYVVTFRQVDPLYVIDLSTPSAPKVLGELKIPGYSGYLHPISDELLLGIGRQANRQGVTGGLQFSLFDVSDAADPRRLDVETVGEYASSEVEQDHHGFLYWHPKRLIVVPASIDDYESGDHWIGAIALTVGPVNGFGEPARLTHMGRSGAREVYPAIRRSLVMHGNLLTVSEAGILASDVDTLDDRRWVALRA